jgi:arginase
VSSWTFLGAPADSVLRGGGAELAPARLRSLGFLGRLGARDAGDLEVAIRGDERDPVTGLIASDRVVANAATIRDAVAPIVGRGDRVFVSGGCCSVAPSASAGARDASGRVALVYVDGHQDLWDGTTSPTGEAADMPFGVALGRGPGAWVDALGGPTVAADDAALVGNRDDEEASAAGLPTPADLGVRHVPLARVRELGPDAAGSAAASVAAQAPGGAWLHLDVDVLDPEVFPATDYLEAGGLGWEELEALLAPVGRVPGLLGASLGCFNPGKDPDGSVSRRLVDVLGGVLPG